MEVQDSDLVYIKEQHPSLLDLPEKSKKIHNNAYNIIVNGLGNKIGKRFIFIKPDAKSNAGLIGTKLPVNFLYWDPEEPAPAPELRADIVVNHNLGNLVEDKAFEHFKSKNKRNVTPTNFLQYAIVHEYCHLFDIHLLYEESANLISNYKKYYLNFNGNRKNRIAVGEGLCHWLAESLTNLSGFEPNSDYSVKANKNLLLLIYNGLKEIEKQKGREYVFENINNILKSIYYPNNYLL